MEIETSRKENEMSRFILFLITDMLEPEVEPAKFLSLLQSDHSPVVLKLRSTDSAEKGRSYWKFDNSFLNDAEFVIEMKEFISEVVKKFNFFDDPRD